MIFIKFNSFLNISFNSVFALLSAIIEFMHDPQLTAKNSLHIRRVTWLMTEWLGHIWNPRASRVCNIIKTTPICRFFRKFLRPIPIVHRADCNLFLSAGFIAGRSAFMSKSVHFPLDLLMYLRSLMVVVCEILSVSSNRSSTQSESERGFWSFVNNRSMSTRGHQNARKIQITLWLFSDDTDRPNEDSWKCKLQI